jgi:hypothetical protein
MKPRSGISTTLLGFALSIMILHFTPSAVAAKEDDGRKNAPYFTTLIVGWNLNRDDISFLHTAVLGITCTSGSQAKNDDDDDRHRNQSGRGHHEHGQGHGYGHDKDRGRDACPAAVDMRVTLTDQPPVGNQADCPGTVLGTSFVSNVAVPGSATFDFNPDVPIVPIQCVSVTLYKVGSTSPLLGARAAGGSPQAAPIATFKLPLPRRP